MRPCSLLDKYCHCMETCCFCHHYYPRDGIRRLLWHVDICQWNYTVSYLLLVADLMTWRTATASSTQALFYVATAACHYLSGHLHDRVCHLSPVPASLKKSFPACCNLSGSHGYMDVVSLLLELEVVSLSVLFLILSDHCLVLKQWKWKTQTHNIISQKKGYNISRTSLNMVSRTLILTANYIMDLVEHLSTSWSLYNIFVLHYSNSCFTPSCLKPYQLTTLHNLCPLVFTLTPSAWLSTEMTINDTTPNLIIINISNSYNIICTCMQYVLCRKWLFDLHPLSQEHN